MKRRYLLPAFALLTLLLAACSGGGDSAPSPIPPPTQAPDVVETPAPPPDPPPLSVPAPDVPEAPVPPPGPPTPPSDPPPPPPQAPPRILTTLTTDIDLLAAPAPDAAVLDRVAAGRRIPVLGRSEDARWIVVDATPRSGPRAVGWLPLDPTRLEVAFDIDELPLVIAPGLWTVPLDPADGPATQIDAAALPHLVWSPDSAVLLYATGSLFAQDAATYAFDPLTGQRHAAATGTSPASFSPDGQHVAYVAITTGDVFLWQIRIIERDRLGIAEPPIAGTLVLVGSDQAQFLARIAGRWSPDGFALLAWDRYDFERFIEPDQTSITAPIKLFTIDGERVLRMGSEPAWTANGDILFAADGHVRRMDPSGTPRPFPLEIPATDIAVAAGGERFAALTQSEPDRWEAVTIHDRNGDRLAELPPADRATWSPDGAAVALSLDDALVVYAWQDGDFVVLASAELPHMQSVVWSPANDHLLIDAQSGLWLLDLTNENLVPIHDDGEAALGLDTVWSPDAQHFVTSQVAPFAPLNMRQVTIYDAAGNLVREVGRTFNFTRIVWHPDGTAITLASVIAFS